MTMKFKVSRADMWSATIEDQPGGAARVLDPVAKAGANSEFAFARKFGAIVTHSPWLRL